MQQVVYLLEEPVGLAVDNLGQLLSHRRVRASCGRWTSCSFDRRVQRKQWYDATCTEWCNVSSGWMRGDTLMKMSVQGSYTCWTMDFQDFKKNLCAYIKKVRTNFVFELTRRIPKDTVNNHKWQKRMRDNSLIKRINIYIFSVTVCSIAAQTNIFSLILLKAYSLFKIQRKWTCEYHKFPWLGDFFYFFQVFSRPVNNQDFSRFSKSLRTLRWHCVIVQ